MEKEKEKEKICCPNCEQSKKMEGKPEMTTDYDRGYLFCSICGLLLKISWIKETAEKLK